MAEDSWTLMCLEPKTERIESVKGKGPSRDCDNIADLLPADPFGMDIKSTVTSIKGWFQEIDEDVSSNFDKVRNNDVENFTNSDRSAFFFQSHDTYPNSDDYEICPYADYNEIPSAHNAAGCDDDVHSGFLLALNHLEAEDLITMEGVCRSLRDYVRGEPLLWKNMKVKQPLSLKITDDILVKLTNRAQSYLESLSLIDCIKISDKGLMQVLLNNPRLATLSVPGCIRLTVDGTLRNLRVVKEAGTMRIKHLRIGGLGCVSDAIFEELKSLLGMGRGVELRPKAAQYFHLGPVYLTSEDERPIDVEACPACGRIGLVYDCPAEKCRGDGDKCRACTLCISRCIECGRCIKDRDYEETFLFDFICLDCFKELLCPDKPKLKAPVSAHTYFRQEMRYHYRICGGT